MNNNKKRRNDENEEEEEEGRTGNEMENGRESYTGESKVIQN